MIQNFINIICHCVNCCAKFKSNFIHLRKLEFLISVAHSSALPACALCSTASSNCNRPNCTPRTQPRTSYYIPVPQATTPTTNKYQKAKTHSPFRTCKLRRGSDSGSSDIKRQPKTRLVKQSAISTLRGRWNNRFAAKCPKITLSRLWLQRPRHRGCRHRLPCHQRHRHRLPDHRNRNKDSRNWRGRFRRLRPRHDPNHCRLRGQRQLAMIVRQCCSSSTEVSPRIQTAKCSLKSRDVFFIQCRALCQRPSLRHRWIPY